MSRWLFWVAYEWVLIASAVAVASRWPLLWPLVVLFLGTRQHALAVLGHEAVHYAVYSNRYADDQGRTRNDRLGNLLCMWPLLADVEGFRRFHIDHHRYVGTNLDPERQVREPFLERWTNLTPRKKAGLIAFDLVGGSIDEATYILRETRGRMTKGRAAYVLGLAGVAVACVGLAPVVAWGVALVTANFAVMRARMWREHLGPEVTEVYEARWWERALYLPHHIWRHEPHHRNGCWSVSAWDLKRL